MSLLAAMPGSGTTTAERSLLIRDVSVSDIEDGRLALAPRRIEPLTFGARGLELLKRLNLQAD